MDAKNIKKITGVSSALIYKERLHEKSNSELKAWLLSKLNAVEKTRQDLENAESGYVALLDLLENV